MRPKIIYVPYDNISGWESYCGAFEVYAYKLAEQAGNSKRVSALVIGNMSATFIATKERVLVIINQNKGNFATHPRNGVPEIFPFPGSDVNLTTQLGIAHLGLGYTGDISDGIGEVPYPLVDDTISPTETDDKTTVFSSDDNTLWEVDKNVEYDYGNVDWKGGSEDYPLVLSYKGNPSRYWPVDQFRTIPGLSSIDHTIESAFGDYSYMTVFGPHVYENGSIAYTMPNLYAPTNSANQPAQVLGAAYLNDGRLVAVIKTCYISTTGEGGYWFEVIRSGGEEIEGGWTRLLKVYTNANMPNCNFFFSEDGTKACSVMLGELHLIELIDDTASYRTESLGGFTQNIHTTRQLTQIENPGTPVSGSLFGGLFREGVNVGDWIGKTDTKNVYTTTKSGTLIIAADYKGNELVKMEATLTGEEEHTEEKSEGYKWGETGLPTASNGGIESDDASRTPVVGITSDLFTGDSFNGGYCAGYYGACDPQLSGPGTRIEGTNCFTMDDPRIGNCDSNYDLSVTISDLATGRFQTSVTRYEFTIDYPSVSISGTGTDGAVQVGDTAHGSGGTAPYTYVMINGTINPATGVVTALDCPGPGELGVGYIFVTDACGNQSNPVTFRLQSGSWVEDISQRWDTYTATVGSVCIGGGCGTLPPGGNTTITGTTKTVISAKISMFYRTANPEACGYTLFITNVVPGTLVTCPPNPPYQDLEGYFRSYVYDWKCP